MATPGSGNMSMLIARAVVDALGQLDAPEKLDPDLVREVTDWNGDPHVWIPRQRLLGHLVALRTTLGQPDLGLRIAQRMTGMSFHFASPLLHTRLTLRDGLRTFAELKRSVLGGPTWELHEHGERATFGYADDLDEAGRLDAEMAVTTFQRGLSNAVADAGGGVWALFAHPAPPYVERFRELLGGRVRFDAECNGVEFPRALLDHVRPGASPEIATAVSQMSEQWLAPPSSWSARVRRELAALDDLSNLDLGIFAKRFAMSSRSLRRKLEQEGAQLSALVDEVRAARAKKLLLNRAHSLVHIAHKLGYHEPNSFARAFKRWFGVSPARFRLSARDETLAADDVAAAPRCR